MKKLLSVILSALLLVGALAGISSVSATEASATAWDGSVASSFAGGDGTQSNPYQIANGAQLALMAKNVNEKASNANELKYAEAYYKLVDDIKLNPTQNWTPIGVSTAEPKCENNGCNCGKTNFSDSSVFRGVFDGNGHTISDLYVKRTSKDRDGAGLFAVVSGATIKNLVLVNANVESTGTKNSCPETAALVAFVNYPMCETAQAAEPKTLIDSVYVQGNVVGFKTDAAGIVGILKNGGKDVTISNCVFTGNVTAKDDQAAGILGNGNNCGVTIKNCLNASNVNAEGDYAAGIMGRHDGNATEEGGEFTPVWTIEGCITVGSINGGSARQIASCKSGTGKNNTLKNCYYDDSNDYDVCRLATTTPENVQAKKFDAFIGNSADVTLEGWTKRDGDIIIPTGVANFAPATFKDVTYQVKWYDEDGKTVLKTTTAKAGELLNKTSYNGEAPTKTSDELYNYTFDKWTPEFTRVFGNTSYAATFYGDRSDIVWDGGEEKPPKKDKNTTDTTPSTPQSETEAATEDGGCGSTVGLGAIAIVTVIGSALAVSSKKKED